MVQIDKVPGSQINQLTAMLAGRVLYDSTINALRLNDSMSYNNILMHKDINNNLSNINNVVTTGTLGINTSAPDKQVEINSSTFITFPLDFEIFSLPKVHHPCAKIFLGVSIPAEISIAGQ